MDKWNDGTYFSRKAELLYMHCDKYRCAHVASLLGLLIETAIDGDTASGFGLEYYAEYRQTYVYTRLAMRIKALPECGSMITATGWYTGAWDNRFHRDFELTDENNDVQMTVRVEKALFDADSRRVLATDDLHSEPFQPSDRRADAPDCKMVLIEHELPVIGHRPILFSDIDNNWHVGYINIIKICIDYLPDDFRDSGYSDAFFNFVREVPEGETVEVRGDATENGYLIQGFVGGKLRFCGEFLK